jgi:hypothetical protein
LCRLLYVVTTNTVCPPTSSRPIIDLLALDAEGCRDETITTLAVLKTAAEFVGLRGQTCEEVNRTT